MELRPGEHTAILAVTRAGKSWFVRDHLLKCYSSYVIYDSKRQDPWADWTGAYTCWTTDQLAKALIAGKRKIHYASRPMDKKSRIDEINTISEIILRAGGIALIVDEASHVMSSSYLPNGLEKLAVSGAGRKCTLIVGSQRPKSIVHPTIISQSLHIFMGYLSQREITPELKRWLPVECMPEWGSYEFIYVGPSGDPIKVGGIKKS